MRTLFASMVVLCWLASGVALAELPAPDAWQPNWLTLQDDQTSDDEEPKNDAPKIACWLDKEMIAEGWLQLSNDASMFGWQATNDEGWTLCANHQMYYEGQEKGWLMTTTEWTDFELVVDYTCNDEQVNSGVFIRSKLEPENPTSDCYEVNIAPESNDYPTGSIVGHARGKYEPDQLASLGGKDNQVHRLEITANGPQIVVKRDGKLVCDYVDNSPAPRLKGRIGLQYKEGVVHFRRVLLKPLNTKPIFNGKDLTGWKTDLAGPAEFSVTKAGEMQVLGGSGQAESTAVYGDFVLQYECKVNGDGANSGVFFRSIPGDKMNGYECQVQNTYVDGDRTQPKDCGTGGIYRRVNARLVNASDHEWFTTTVHADGPHIGTWVNGLQVVDWTDTRKPDDNPRRGLRTEAGTFCLQAHDPTTNLLFRNMRVQSMITQH
ncbi:3-keto-disaccharide hydrolase [Aeoliella mucimassa]|uniref:3-keto-alpha-glucoside-1,2-lyase/3-keto-2-hydroxy-glucal hydratase domain-containing protein n=1 Tax=Aeoliella mucimassa TaxID=2527972 RepID=A0A518AMN9_9BACT|nr:DUF1080 domain-containing protein [Aeoliella mucimassa]QDU55990.1 hypothetical protein Pan181_21920 [Aeoliella mucimassa]